jgi:cytochrome c biogenesis protein CcmG/thiol:disulfide interchange protein DsbE
MSRALRFAPIALLLILLAGLVWRLARPEDTAVRSALVGQPVPKLALPPAVPGKPGLDSAALASGKPRLVNLFASWCVPCIAEAPILEELEKRGVAIDAIAIRDRPEDISEFLTRHGDPYASIGADPTSRAQLALGSAGVPESFVVDGRGVVRYQHIGPIEAKDVAVILAQLEQAR